VKTSGPHVRMRNVERACEIGAPQYHVRNCSRTSAVFVWTFAGAAAKSKKRFAAPHSRAALEPVSWIHRHSYCCLLGNSGSCNICLHIVSICMAVPIFCAFPLSTIAFCSLLFSLHLQNYSATCFTWYWVEMTMGTCDP
jgi:hypothetical protein